MAQQWDTSIFDTEVNFQWEITNDTKLKLLFSHDEKRANLTISKPFQRSREDWEQFIYAIRYNLYLRLEFYEGDHDLGYILADGFSHCLYISSMPQAGVSAGIRVRVPIAEFYADRFAELLEHPVMQQGWQLLIDQRPPGGMILI